MDEALERQAMDEALRQAEAAGRLGNVPVGAVVVQGGRIVAAAGNLRDTLQDPTAHAELLALRKAAQHLGVWRMPDAAMVVTLEPCAMCAAAIRQARLGTLVYAAAEPKTGAVHSTERLLDGSACAIRAGLLEADSLRLVQDFFARLRQSGRRA